MPLPDVARGERSGKLRLKAHSFSWKSNDCFTSLSECFKSVFGKGQGWLRRTRKSASLEDWEAVGGRFCRVAPSEFERESAPMGLAHTRERARSSNPQPYQTRSKVRRSVWGFSATSPATPSTCRA